MNCFGKMEKKNRALFIKFILPFPMFFADVAVSLPRLSQVFSRQKLDYTEYIS